MKWNLELIYDSVEQFESDLRLLNQEIDNLALYQGKLHNAIEFKKYLLLETSTSKILEKLYCYANMKYHLNQKDQDNLNLSNKIMFTYEKFISSISFVSSEILELGYEKVMDLVKNDNELSQYIFRMESIFRSNKHVKSSDTELILSYFNAPLNNYSKLYSQLAVADNSGVKVKISTGEEIEVNDSNFRGYLEKLPNQDDRRLVFEAVFKHYDSHKNTFASIYQGVIQGNIANSKARDYEDFLQSFLFGNNISKDVYLNLINTVKNNTDTLKHYYDIRKKYFNLEEIHTYDRFLTFAKNDGDFSYDECVKLFLESVKPIGGEFEQYAQEVIKNGYVDVYSSDGKRTGAYSMGVTGVGPFILLNHNNTLSDCFTVAHEAGHSMHTMFSSKYQPYELANYTIFVAEIASTFNEQLLLDNLMNKPMDDQLKIVMLQSAIDGLIGTFYRQSLFADYEYQAHSLVEKQGSVNYSELSNIMINLYQTYFGVDLNNELYKDKVWAYIPHFFFSPFYVYQYATSYAASMQIYQDVKANKPDALNSYLNLLKSGGSDYPLNQVLMANVDLTTDKPFMAVIERFTHLVDELEKLLNKEN